MEQQPDKNIENKNKIEKGFDERIQEKINIEKQLDNEIKNEIDQFDIKIKELQDIYGVLEEKKNLLNQYIENKKEEFKKELMNQ